MPKPDPAHQETDKILLDMEKRLDEVYKQAYKEARQTADDFMKQFREMDKKKRQQVKDGKLDKAEYDRWRRTQVFQGNRYHQMADTLAADMTHTNQIAASVINGYLPEVYAVNHNYGTYEIEKGSRINTQYTMYDKQTVERLIRDNPDLLPRKAAVNVPKDEIWNKKHINSAVMQGIIQGDPIDKISQRLAATVTDMSHTSAIRNARTMTTSAQNGGRIDSYKRAESMGIKILQVWMATLDSRTRHEHRQLDGQKRKVGEAFEVEGEKIFFPGDPAADPALVYNCFVGDTKVASDSELIRSYKHKYSGQVITVKTAKGVNFTCTPNHPILTPFGWIAANRLNKGDNILVTIIGDKSTLRRYSDIDHIHPCIETVHNSFKSNGFVSRNSPLTVNFHSDIPTSEVEVVTKKRLLRFNRDTRFGKLLNKFILKNTDESFMCKSTLMKHFGRVARTSFRNISRKCKSFSLFGRSLSHSDIHRLGTVSWGDTLLTEYPIDNLTAKAVIDGELLDRLSGKVFLDNIVDINVSVLETHVYNLQTKNGYYFTNSIIPQKSNKNNGIFAISKNCRCTLIGEVEGVDYNLSDVSQRDNKLGDMTYEEWKEEKRKQDNVEPNAPKKPEPPKNVPEGKAVEVDMPAPKVEKPDAVDEPIPQREEFKPASTIEEAEQFIMQYMDFDQFGALREVSYKGIALDAANEINATISRLYNEFNVDKFGGIVAPAKNTKLGKAIDEAVAGYMPMRNSFVLNKSALKSVKIAEKGFAEENKLMKDMLEHPEKYDFNKLSRAARTVIENSKISGRGTVPDNITEALTHEFGHALEKQVKKHELWDKVEKDMQTYAPKISGYATTQKGEYIAESFASWQKGEKFADPNLIKIFESLRRK